MTANTTPRLGLMDPVDTDYFLPSDFHTSFNKLDSTPGITLVPNYSGAGGLTTLGWGVPQDGSLVLQKDNGALWRWSNPSGSGVWTRINTVGMLHTLVSTGARSTTTQTDHTYAFNTSPVTFTIPGGRPVTVKWQAGMAASTSQTGFFIMSVWDSVNGGAATKLTEVNGRVGSNININGNGFQWEWFLNHNPVVAAPSTHSITMYMRAGDTASRANGGAGTVSCQWGFIIVSEM